MNSEILRRPYEHVVSDLLGGVGGPPLLVVCGPPGADLDSALDEVLAACARNRPTPRKVVNLSFGELRPASDSVLLVKEAQRLSAKALAALEVLVRQLRNTTSTCVCVVTLPVPPRSRAAFAAVFDRLCRDGLLRWTTLRPLAPARLGAMVAESIEAELEPDALVTLSRLSGGWPVAARAALDGYREAGLMRTVGDRVYLGPVSRSMFAIAGPEAAPGGTAGLPTYNSGMRAVRPHRQEPPQARLSSNGTSIQALGDGRPVAETSSRWLRGMNTETWPVAGAIAVLGPLGPAAPRLSGEGLGVTEAVARDHLTRLVQSGFLRYHRAEGAWRFRVPLVAGVLEQALGPYERRRLARIAVSALWRGIAVTSDPGYLPDQLVHAGAMVDRNRARRELLAAARRLPLSGRTIHWLWAAAELTRDQAERMDILLLHARTCLALGEAELARESSAAVLRCYCGQAGRGVLREALLTHLTALHRAGEGGVLEKVGSDGWWPWPGDALEQAVGRAHALSLLGEWRAAREVLAVGPSSRADPDAVEGIDACAGLWLGEPTVFDRLLSEPDRLGACEVNRYAGALLVLGEVGRAERLLAGGRATLDLPGRAVVAARTGRFDEAIELTDRSIATGAPHGCDDVETAMYQLVALAQLSRGRLTQARELIATARSRGPVLPHLLSIAEAHCELVLGDGERAEAVLTAAVRQSEEDGVLARTEGLWVALADLAVQSGRADLVSGYLTKVTLVAARTGTETAEIAVLTLRALVGGDEACADAAVRLVRRRDQPLEQVFVLPRLVQHGVGDPALLAPVYALLGDMKALLGRARLRTMMRAYGVGVPGRQEAVAENERLLAVLVAEGLSNRQIATVLDCGERSVEGRLSRLFARSGHRSRVALATAMLTGRFQ